MIFTQTALRLTLLFTASVFTSACEMGTSRDITIMADSPKLGLKDIGLPATVKMTKLGRFNGVVDVSWLASNFKQIASKSLPREGGSGGNRYHFSKFSLTANPDGTLRGFVHVALDNYKYTNFPRVEWKAGHIESDVIATITPVFTEGVPTIITSTKVIKTKHSGFVRLWNNALPKIWFSLDRQFQTANNAANKKKKAELPVLNIQKNPDLDPFIDDILKQGLISGKSIKFEQSEKGLTLVLDYQVVGGLPAYYKIYKSYTNKAYQPRPMTIATDVEASTEPMNKKP